MVAPQSREAQAELVRSIPIHRLGAWDKSFVRQLGLLLHKGKRLSAGQVAYLEKIRDEVRKAFPRGAIQAMAEP